MPRRREVPKRHIIPDSKYGERIVAQFINCLMRQGKKSLAESILYKSFDLIEARTKEEPVKVFKKALDNARPLLEVRSRRIGGATYQVPAEVRAEKRVSMAMRWLINYAKQKSGKSMEERLAAEIIDAYNNRGTSVKKKEELHRMAEANKAFAHYRW
ncbi:MAG: 30S ribosomal protein S7 [Thermodesulfobacteriota bacterium]